ncbi:loc397781 related [Cystoisospora suis]|uniref:Loc397781 related n=1 Tax=Cystoisospora suis TaxID=483139 RepID=A0A2C6KHA6_9APIC|nr:loc397781 related [Cystoisospora suis]
MADVQAPSPSTETNPPPTSPSPSTSPKEGSGSLAGTKRRQSLSAHELRDREEGRGGGEDASEEESSGDGGLAPADPATLQKRQRLRIVRSGNASPANDQPSVGLVTPAGVGSTSSTAPEKAEEKTEEKTDGPQKTDEANKNGTPEKSLGDSSADSAASSILKGTEIKGTPTFSSAFLSLTSQPQKSSFFLSPSSATTAPGGNEGGTGGQGGGAVPSLFSNLSFPSKSIFGASISPAAGGENEEDEQQPEEPTVIDNDVDEAEEVIFVDRDCRMQRFDASQKLWVPKPPLDGKVQMAASKKEEDDGSTRILFFVNRTGRLQLNTPLIPSVKYQHPLDRSQQRASPSVILKEDSTEKQAEKKDEELPRKKNTAEFLGLKTDAKSSSDTTMYRIRFSNEEKCAEFVALANERKTRGAHRNAPSPSSNA